MAFRSSWMQLSSWTEESSELGATLPAYLFQVCLPTAFQLLRPNTVSIGLECRTSPELTYKHPARASAEWGATRLSFYHVLFIFPRSPVHQMESCQPAEVWSWLHLILCHAVFSWPLCLLAGLLLSHPERSVLSPSLLSCPPFCGSLSHISMPELA